MMLTFKNFYAEADKNYNVPSIVLKNWITNHPTFSHYLKNIPQEEHAGETENLVNHLHAIFGNKINFGSPSQMKPDEIRAVNLEINRKFPKFIKPHALEEIPQHKQSTSIGSGGEVALATRALQGRKIPKDIDTQHSPIGSGGEVELATRALQGRKIPKDIDTQHSPIGTGGELELTTKKLPPIDRNPSEIDQIIRKEISPKKPNITKEKSKTLSDEIKKAIQRANELGISDPNFLPPDEHPDDHKIAKRKSREKTQSQFDRETGTHLA